MFWKKKKPKKYKSSREKRPDQYFKNTWVSEKSCNIINGVKRMEKLSFKDALELLVEMGGEYYGQTRATVDKLKRASATQAVRDAQEEDSEAVIGFLRRMGKKVFGEKTEKKTDKL